MFQVASRSEADRIFSTVVLAFVADPILRWCYPEPGEFLEHFPHTMNFYGGRAFENESAYRNESFTAAALWLPPGVHPDGESLVAYLEDTVAPEKHKAMFTVIEQMDKFHPVEPCWHLAFLAIDPAHQGKGLGTALLAACLNKCDDDGRPAYLESSNPANLSLYRRFGFEQIGLIEADNAPPHFPMLRRPQKAAT